MKQSFVVGAEGLDVFIPVDLNPPGVGIDRLIQDVIDLHHKAGFNAFMLSGPSKGWRSVGYPSRDEFERIADKILKFKDGVRGYDFKVGWWNTLTLKSGPAAFQRIVFLDGRECPASTCPLDLGFQERFSGDIAYVAERANPALIIFEDDYGMSCHGGDACFCDLHLDFFSKRVGRYYSREQLQILFNGQSEASVSLRAEWEAGLRDSLVQLATRVRQAVDHVAPSIPMGYMQPGCADRDGNSTEAVARAFAGDRHRPFIRLYGTSYCSDDAFTLPENVFHALYCKQHLPEDVICYHESDTFPHNRFFMSAGKMRSLMAAVYSYGFAGSTFQVCQHLDDPNEEAGYYSMFAEERKRFETVQKIAQQSELSGCSVLSAPKQANGWVVPFAHFGIPYTTKESSVNVLSGTLPDVFNDDQIVEFLKHGLLLDGHAAERLCARGFSELLGLSVQGVSTINDPGRDLGSREKIRERFLRDADAGRLMTSFATYAPYGNGSMYHLKPNTASTEIITDLVSFRNETIGVGMTRFCNAEGGRVVTMGMSVAGNRSSSLFNYRRARLIQDLVVWIGAKDIVHVQNQPKIFCIQNRPQANWNTRMVRLVTLINLCSDTCESVELYLPQGLREGVVVNYLDTNGEWVEAEHVFLGATVRIDHPLLLYHPLYLRFVTEADC